MGTFVDDFIGEWNIAGNHQVVFFCTLNNFIIRNIKPLGYLQHTNIFIGGYAYGLVGHECHFHAGTLRGLEQDFFYHNRTP